MDFGFWIIRGIDSVRRFKIKRYLNAKWGQVRRVSILPQSKISQFPSPYVLKSNTDYHTRSDVNRQSSFSPPRPYAKGLLIVGIILALMGAFYWFFARGSVNLVTLKSQPSAVIFVSKLAPAMVSLLVNPEQLSNWQRDRVVSQIKTSLLTKSGLDYKRDIQPWLGDEITLAVTNLDTDYNPDNGLQPGYLMALATKNVEKSREFLKLFFAKRVLAGGNLSVEKYQGVKLITADADKGANYLAGAVVGEKFVLFASDRQVLRAAINNVQAPDLNLLSASQYQKARKQILKDAVAVAFLNLPAVAKWQGLNLVAPIYDSQILSLGLRPQIETSLLSTTAVLPPSLPQGQPGGLKYIPDSPGLVIFGRNLSNLGQSNLGKFWQQAAVTIYGSESEAIARLVKPLEAIQNRWKINLGEDIFSWVTGEYAIALLPHQDRVTPDWVFVVEKTPQVTTGITRLDAIAESNGFNHSSLTLDQQKIAAWTELIPESGSSLKVEAKIQGAHTTLDKYEIFTSDLQTLDQVLHPKKSLIDSPLFQDSITPIPKSNHGYIYIDWQNSRNIFRGQLPLRQWEEILDKPLFPNLRSLTISSYGTDTDVLKGSIFFQFAH